MDNIINDYVKVEVPLNDEWHKKTGIEHQYYYINFVTGEQYCYLTDGSYADMYTFDKSIPLDEDTRKEQRIEFASFGGIVNIEYNNERIRGLEYAEKHGIPQAKWYQNVMLESQEMIEKNKKKASMKTKNNKQTTYYIIQPTVSDKRANECEHVFNALINKHENWQRFDAGWTHEHMMTIHKFTALYGSPDEPHAMLTIGCMNDKLMLKIRFMQYDGEQLDSPDDMDMFMPFEFTNPDDYTGFIEHKLDSFMILIERTADGE